jgi:hypothetical protein
MKKVLFLLLVITISSNFQVFSQGESNNKIAIKKGDFVIDAYYGYATPGVLINSIKRFEGTNNIVGSPRNPSTYVIGPIGVRFQKMVTSDFGIGLDINFEEKYGSWTGGYIAGYDSNLNPFYGDFDCEYKVTKIKAMLRTSWEFSITEDFTANWANSIGYKGGDRILVDPIGDLELGFSGGVFPVAFRTAIGMRYFLADNIALHTEVGFFGGGLIIAGISIKP